jgi:hypothetical protein
MTGLVLSYPRRNPVTAGYVVLLLSTHLWITEWLSPEAAHRLLLAASTNLDNLAEDPVGSLVGSALFFDGGFVWQGSIDTGTLITLAAGVACCLAWLERRHGARWAYTVFGAGHVGATLITAGVIEYALSRGWYPRAIHHSMDFGISYGAEAVLAAMTFVLPWRAARPVWAVAVLAWPVAGGDWEGVLPDFTTVGHLTSAVIGFAVGALLLRLSRRSTGTGGCEFRSTESSPPS